MSARVVAGATKGGPRRRALRAPLQLTEAAADRIKELLEAKPDQVGIRVGVKRRGCNGLSYTMNYADRETKFPDVVEEHGVKVFIEPAALMHVVGTTMDFAEDELAAEFVFHNPNAKGTCGCGESFNV